MTSGETKALAAALERQARSLAATLEAAGEALDAPEEAQVAAELAGLVVRIAQQRATTVSADQADRMHRSLSDLEAELRDGIEAKFEDVRTVAAAFHSADQAVQHAVARLDLEQERALASLAGLTLAAWQCAVLELEGLAPRPAATGMAP